MVRAEVLICVFCIVLVSTSIVEANESVGVNWGTMASHPIHPQIVVDMLKANGIKKVKLFDADGWIIKHLAGTGIETMVAVPNDMLSIISKDYDNAKDWVKENVTKHMYNGGVDIKYVAVGNEPYLTAYNGSFVKDALPALKNIQKALEDAGYGGQIKATVPHNADVYDSSNNKPSTGDWRSDIRSLMIETVKFLHSTKAPFVVNIYPFLSLNLNKDFPLDFAFVDGGGKTTNDNGVQYSNVFDANYDTLVWALKKSGVPDIKIIVGEIGWPTDGTDHASIDLAHRFYKGFMKKMANKKGTPLRPGHLDVFLFSLLDENIKSIAPGTFERHWGIFRYDGRPKFSIDLACTGQETWPVAAQGIRYLPSKWCVLKKDKKDELGKAFENVNYACSVADCTPLGWSCDKLDKTGNISYAYNIYFQMQDQDVQACDFQGLAEITDVNASQSGCNFPLEIQSAGDRLKLVSVTNIVFLLFIVITLM
ncbi:Glucan endo-1,3-beta-glucosidase [Thalictrum thalictroides]|uniref:Glucan endo-1,3-beta-glucosidase n=1 Tax=Thalictrum thalictroides TaxID=46969 RepID=A0A7J6UXT7_THATH|nr:Glucan endo-1,3-beta-glucosidase [Thalictrum thalictroides]